MASLSAPRRVVWVCVCADVTNGSIGMKSVAFALVCSAAKRVGLPKRTHAYSWLCRCDCPRPPSAAHACPPSVTHAPPLTRRSAAAFASATDARSQDATCDACNATRSDARPVQVRRGVAHQQALLLRRSLGAPNSCFARHGAQRSNTVAAIAALLHRYI